MNLKAKRMMKTWNRRAERNYKIAEDFRLYYKETGDEYDWEMHKEFVHRGQLCEQIAADFEELNGE